MIPEQLPTPQQLAPQTKLSAVVKDMCQRNYRNLGPPERQIRWLLDENRIDDAIIYYIHVFGASFIGDALPRKLSPSRRTHRSGFAQKDEYGCIGRP